MIKKFWIYNISTGIIKRFIKNEIQSNPVLTDIVSSEHIAIVVLNVQTLMKKSLYIAETFIAHVNICLEIADTLVFWGKYTTSQNRKYVIMQILYFEILFWIHFEF